MGNNAIRQAVLDDLPEILALQKKAFLQNAVMMDKYDLPPLLQTIEGIAEDLANGVILKYQLPDGSIAGSVRAHQDTEGTCYIGKLVVDPDTQSRGIGYALMREIERYFPDCRRFSLFTSENTPHTLRLYTKVGYRVTLRKDLGGIRMLFMEKLNSGIETE